DSGLVVIHTVLIPNNAEVLKEIMNDLAAKWAMDREHIDWMNNCNDCCSSKVDRMVAGKIKGEEPIKIKKELDCNNDLMTMGEIYGLWAIETERSRTKKLLSFREAFPTIYVVPNVDKFRELKLRLLNGSHNLSCAVGFLAGFGTVKEA